MKVSMQWLREWVDPPLAPAELAERLTMAGLEVDTVERAAPPLTGVTVARVVDTAPHPDADKLRCCRVDPGNGEPVDVVCGAPNVRPGLVVAYAAPGARLPDERTITQATIRGVASSGMLCSAAELALGEDAGGLMELACDAPIGAALRDYLQLDDHIIDIELTPNRGDCLSIAGVAREVAALTDTPMREIDVQRVTPAIDERFPITIDAPAGCPRYAGRLIKNVDAAAPTPVWMRERLRRAGVRSISAIVDVTNFVMLELGQPMHGFDWDRLTSGIRVRNSRAGERLELLDGQTIDLAPDTLVIADEEKAVALAGVMGGAATGVEEHTKNVFLESAYFDAITLAGVARHYRLHTDASHRFERGVDYTGQERAIERATALILEICGGEPGPVVTEACAEHVPSRTEIEFDPEEITRLIGIEFSADGAETIFNALGCRVVGRGGRLLVTPPDFRFDLALEADLLEEIARIHGYDNIPSTLPRAAMTTAGGSVRRDRDQQIRDILVTAGYSEAVTYSFIEADAGQRVAPERAAYALSNPITSEMAVMRTSIWPGLIAAAQHNLHRQVEDIRLFELGCVFELRGDGLDQRHVLAGLALGRVRPQQWGESPRELDFFDVKQEVETVLNALRVGPCEWTAVTDAALHPGQSAALTVAGEVVGKLGALHPRVAGDFDLEHTAFVFEIELERLPLPVVASYTPVSRFPSVRRDISIVLDRRTAAAEVLAAVRDAAGELLRDLQLFDEYRGQGIDSDKKSLAMGLIFQAHSSTLTDEEIEETMKRVLLQLRESFGGTLRN